MIEKIDTLANVNTIKDVIIIGGGAAGLFCGATFSSSVNGVLLEKTSRLGTKLLMSGSGQCNITHGGSIKEFVSHYGANGSKIRSLLYKYSNNSLRLFLSDNSVETIEREDEKVFPSSFSSQDVLKMLLKKCHSNGFEIICNADVINIFKEGTLFNVKTPSHSYYSHKVIVACGGCSYPSTGSDGSMLKILKDSFNLKVVEPKPSLVPLYVLNYPFEQIAGTSFNNIEVSIYRDNKKIASQIGDVLLTHKNFSGPAILDISRYSKDGDLIKFNYMYPSNYESTLEKVNNAIRGNKKSFDNIICEELKLPKRFVQTIIRDTGYQTKLLCQILCGHAFTVTGTSGYKEAMCTAGGISLDEINFSNMEAKSIPGLHLIGEMVDIDGDTGGYNLQFAYSSAKAANRDFNNK